MNTRLNERTREQREQGKSDRKRIKQLEKELLRKEKALAEAAALIILKKKPRRSGGGSRGRLTDTRIASW